MQKAWRPLRGELVGSGRWCGWVGGGKGGGGGRGGWEVGGGRGLGGDEGANAGGGGGGWVGRGGGGGGGNGKNPKFTNRRGKHRNQVPFTNPTDTSLREKPRPF